MSRIDLTALIREAADVGIDERCAERLSVYSALLREYNQKVNLTAVTDEREIVIKHFADSLALTRFVDLPEGARLADVGTGAGFPGMALLIARPDLDVTLFDSVDKKLEFLRLLSAQLGLSPRIVHVRAEDAGRDPGYRGSFDLVTARAVAALPTLCEYCVPLVRVGGIFAPMKAELSDDERTRGVRAAQALGCELSRDERYEIAGAGKREIPVFTKTKNTPSRFPRPTAQIKKNPLPLN